MELGSIEYLVRQSTKRTHSLFSAEEAFQYEDQTDRASVLRSRCRCGVTADAPQRPRSHKLRLASKINAEYGNAKLLPAALLAQQSGQAAPLKPGTAPPARKLLGDSSTTRTVDQISYFPPNPRLPQFLP